MRILSIAFISSITTAISFGTKFFVFGGVEKVEHVGVVDTKFFDVDTKFFDVDGVEKVEHVVVVVDTKFFDVDGVEKVCGLSFNFALKGAIPCKIFRMNLIE